MRFLALIALAALLVLLASWILGRAKPLPPSTAAASTRENRARLSRQMAILRSCRADAARLPGQARNPSETLEAVRAIDRRASDAGDLIAEVVRIEGEKPFADTAALRGLLDQAVAEIDAVGALLRDASDSLRARD